MAYLTRDDLLRSFECPTREYTSEELGGTILLRGLTAAEWTAIESRLIPGMSGSKKERAKAKEASRKAMAEVRIRTIQKGAITEDGDLIFTVDDLDLLRQWPAKPVLEMYKILQELTGTDNEDTETADEDFD